MRTAGPAAVMIDLLIRFDRGALRSPVPQREGVFLVDEFPRRVPALTLHAGTVRRLDDLEIRTPCGSFDALL